MSKAVRKHAVSHPAPIRPKLTLVHGNKNNKKPKSNFKVYTIFFVIVATSLSLFFVFSSKHSLNFEMATNMFFGLHEVYRQEGLQRFLEEKKRLKKHIAQTLENPTDEEEEIFASNVAVYLFPDILPDKNFEKPVATEQWMTLQESIEKSPRTPESRLWFEEMRANIWNYENPDRVYPKVSNYAKEALKIYDELSSP